MRKKTKIKEPTEGEGREEVKTKQNSRKRQNKLKQ